MYNQSHDRGYLQTDVTEGLISVLYKKKDRKDPRNYRPITLLNGDYKILMRVLTARVNKAVVQFVSSPQNGFVPGGFIVENILLLQMLQAYAEEEDIDSQSVTLPDASPRNTLWNSANGMEMMTHVPPYTAQLRYS